VNVSIEGHTDKVGNAASNQTLSEQRAQSVMNLLINKGISKERLTSKGWGQSNPVADNRTEEGKAKNRRVEIVKK
jgi:OmpA-OmpF porin, OOP family